jgi:hypothetical protein
MGNICRRIAENRTPFASTTISRRIETCNSNGHPVDDRISIRVPDQRERSPEVRRRVGSVVVSALWDCVGQIRRLARLRTLALLDSARLRGGQLHYLRTLQSARPSFRFTQSLSLRRRRGQPRAAPQQVGIEPLHQEGRRAQGLGQRLEALGAQSLDQR